MSTNAANPQGAPSRDGESRTVPVLRPVTASTAFEETVERLGTAVRLGLLTPGSKLPGERELAEQLHISRGTLGKAIATLVQSGHLRSIRGRNGGTFIADSPPLTSQALDVQWQQLLRWRVGTEIGAIALATRYAEPRDLKALTALIEEMDEVAEDYARYRRADSRFHIAIAEAGGADALVVAMTDLHARISNLLALIAHPIEVRFHSNEQHRAMLEAIEVRDAPKAVEIMNDHTAGTELIVTGLFGSRDPS